MTDTHDAQVLDIMRDIGSFLQDHQYGERADIDSLAQGWCLYNQYANFLEGAGVCISFSSLSEVLEQYNAYKDADYATPPPPHLRLLACIAQQQDNLTAEVMRISDPAERLETALEMLSAFDFKDDWDKSRFLTDIIFTMAKEIGPGEEQELVSVFLHIAEDINDKQKADAYRADCVAAAYRHGNINVAVEMSPDMQRLEEIGLSGSFTRPAHTGGNFKIEPLPKSEPAGDQRLAHAIVSGMLALQFT